MTFNTWLAIVVTVMSVAVMINEVRRYLYIKRIHQDIVERQALIVLRQIELLEQVKKDIDTGKEEFHAALRAALAAKDN